MTRRPPVKARRVSARRPKLGTIEGTYLVQVATPQPFDQLVSLLLRQSPLGRQDLAERRVDLSRHVSGVTADVEERALLDEIIDLLGMLAQSVLDVNLLWSIAGEGSDQLEGVT